MKNPTAGLILLAFVNTLLAPGCATLTRLGTQEIPVTSDPIEAIVKVDGRYQGVTPVMINLRGNKRYHIIRIESPGYDPIEIRPKRELVAQTFINFLVGFPPGAVLGIGYAWGHDPSPGVIGPLIWAGTTLGIGGLLMLMDISTGSGYNVTPKNIDVTLVKSQGPLRVQTVPVDAGALRNIKWIRVRRN